MFRTLGAISSVVSLRGMVWENSEILRRIERNGGALASMGVPTALIGYGEEEDTISTLEDQGVQYCEVVGIPSVLHLRSPGC